MANWPTGRSVEHRKRRPTVSPSAKANGRLAGVYLRDLAPDARRRNPQVPAPNAGPPPRGSANPSTFAPNWYPCRLALRPCSTADPPGWARCRANVPVSGVDSGGHRPAIQSGPVPRPAVAMSDGPTGLLIAEPRRRGPPCRAVIAQDRRQLTVDWSLLRSRGPWPTGAHVGWATGVPIEQALHSLGTATPCASPMPARQLAIRPGRSSAPWPTLWPSPCRMGQLACPVREGVGHHRDPAVPGGPPSKRPALPDPLQQGYLTAYTTRLVTSVVCRGFIPARGDIAIRQPAPRGFSRGAVASLLRFVARRPIRIQLRRAGQHRRVPARILT
ncbi:hypothetical protein COH20_012073 [Aspergillus flavus]|uniref:Uncharacterized protein n=1 Tax=Aspergillus flavus TaxID=5059 RepID=A0AB74CSW6_ASPFL|nr:hypothetical protein COH20_012073 [Aspergillus flavus]RAQ67733.1 hypothetical protein COH21_012794 [Aspergillus flavus]RMZ48315.1 hypothetical protein CA14_012860 [Aspergillus flavus]